jgi:23S rRNA (cytidine1920-2'-O)/16S rRNA (cytidine1409-2'-O)-methyltransferase
MGRKARPRLRALREELVRRNPRLDDPDAAIYAGRVLVDGRIVTNPASQVRPGAAIRISVAQPLRGEAKLEAALEVFAIDPRGCVALDAGAAAGGFTRVLLRHGARRVYAVDAGHGQLLGSLRQDTRVVDLEATNLGVLGPELVPDQVDVVTLDLSYLALADAVPQLERIRLAADIRAVALVKPQFELGLARPPRSTREATEHAAAAIEAAGWRVVATVESPVRGRRGSVEAFVHATRVPPCASTS